jgi:hypothetical protein
MFVEQSVHGKINGVSVKIKVCAHKKNHPVTGWFLVHQAIVQFLTIVQQSTRRILSLLSF